MLQGVRKILQVFFLVSNKDERESCPLRSNPAAVRLLYKQTELRKCSEPSNRAIFPEHPVTKDDEGQ